eukprot:CAMPEP_0197465178 /NCGR_PEP_ID=MMETSP1175-20131217/64405_1 /TAXON_ID=1003142 /ORGANISM="Triceratium dubium, Strain CCMP147" /LENGTH=411 /DNA_ID=CAMNT_0043001183 /DNA_START=410 /DNA_END=1645 /DNA_ORIENTATION=-
MKLIDLARRQRWSALAARAESHPHEVFDVDENLFTALHWACFNRPDPRAVRAMLVAFAQVEKAHANTDNSSKEGSSVDPNLDMTAPTIAATRGNIALMVDKDEGMTALHAACCSHASTEVIFELVQSCPAAVMVQDKSGWTPLHFACHTALSVMEEANYTADVARILIDAEPTVVLCEDRYGNSALECFVAPFGNLVSYDWTFGGSVPAGSADGWFWSVASLLIKEASSHYFPRNFSEAHSVLLHESSQEPNYEGHHAPVMHQVALMPPSHVYDQLIPYIAAKFPGQIKKIDSAGNTALHIAAGVYSSSRICSGNPDVIRALILAYPEAAFVRNRSYQLPLTVAIESGRSWEGGVKDLLQLHPDALQLYKLQCKLYPLLLGRFAVDCAAPAQTALFKIIRSRPDLLHGCAL